MATIYKGEIQVTSPFCNLDPQVIEEIVTKALKDYRHPESGLQLEAISVSASRV